MDDVLPPLLGAPSRDTARSPVLVPPLPLRLRCSFERRGASKDVATEDGIEGESKAPPIGTAAVFPDEPLEDEPLEPPELPEAAPPLSPPRETAEPVVFPFDDRS